MTRRTFRLVSIAALAAALAACAQTATAPAAPLTEAPAAPAAVERVTKGNLVLESIPEIPPEISERLTAYENVRGQAIPIRSMRSKPPAVPGGNLPSMKRRSATPR
nr:hypothetical protein [Hyphomonas sp. 34-62-18]